MTARDFTDNELTAMVKYLRCQAMAYAGFNLELQRQCLLNVAKSVQAELDSRKKNRRPAHVLRR